MSEYEEEIWGWVPDIGSLVLGLSFQVLEMYLMLWGQLLGRILVSK